MADTPLCERCQLPHTTKLEPATQAELMLCVNAQADAMRKLLALVGTSGFCRGCQAPIFWVRHLNGPNTPYTLRGLNHFVNCPERAKFQKKKL